VRRLAVNGAPINCKRCASNIVYHVVAGDRSSFGFIFSFDVLAATGVAAVMFDDSATSVETTCAAAAALDTFAVLIDVELVPSSTTVSISSSAASSI
jgi:hypothetical protein